MPMTGDQFRDALIRLGLKQTGDDGAESFFGIGERTARRWIKDGPPDAVAMLCLILLRKRISVATARRIFGEGLQ